MDEVRPHKLGQSRPHAPLLGGDVVLGDLLFVALDKGEREGKRAMGVRKMMSGEKEIMKRGMSRPHTHTHTFCVHTSPHTHIPPIHPVS